MLDLQRSLKIDYQQFFQKLSYNKSEMNYIFLTNQYLPKPGATGLCVHYVAKELKMRGHNVNVICFSENLPSKEIIDEVDVIKIKVPFCLRADSGKNFIVKKIRRLSVLAHKLYHWHSYPMRSNSLVKSYYSAAMDLLCKMDLRDTILVATYTPIEACAALIRIKRKLRQVKGCFYSTDTLSNERGSTGFLSANYREKKGFEWEKRIFGVVDIAIIMECHKSHYFQKQYVEFSKKIRLANFPLINPSSKKKDKMNHKDKLLVYAGTLYKKMRNPTFLCEMLSQLQSIRVVFIGSGDCEEIIKRYEQRTAGKICYLGMQTHSKALHFIHDADVLLSIGNNESPMAPSKIYEYMSTGKPIIHVFNWNEDPCIEPLQKYGNALLIDEKIPVNINDASSFIFKGSPMTYNDVFSNFKTSTPMYTADLMEDVNVNRCLD